MLYLVFVFVYREFFAPYFPRGWDQLWYLNDIYSGYYKIIDRKTLAAVADAFTTNVPAFKGVFAGWLSLTGMLFFGPDRLVPASVNFLALGYLAAIAIFFLRTKEAPYLGSVAFGFVLLSNSLYLPAGGIFDVRLDFPGLCTFGGFVIALVSFDQSPSRRRGFLVICTALVTLFTRSISGVYVVGTILSYTGLVGLAWLLDRKSALRIRRAIILAFALSLAVASFAVAFWDKLGPYYVGQLTAELNFRLIEFGVDPRFGLPGYYLNSAWHHLSSLLGFAAILLVATGFANLYLRHRADDAKANIESKQFRSVIIVCSSAVLAVLVPLSVSSPSPVLADALTVPAAVASGALVYRIFGRYLRDYGHALARAMLALGALYFLGKVTVGVPPQLAEMAYLRAHNELYSRLRLDLAPSGKIAWLAATEGLHGVAFDVFLRENRFADQAAGFVHIEQNPFTSPANTLEQSIMNADAIIIWSRILQGTLYPAIESLRETETSWRPKIDRHFVARFEFSAQLPGTITYFLRNPRIRSRPEPVEFVRLGGDRPVPFTWLTETGGQLAVENVLDRSVEVVLHARVVPGPSFKDQSRRLLRVETPQQSYEIEAGEATQWRVSLPLTIPAGVTRLQIKAILPTAERVAVPNDPRTLIAGIWDLRLE